MTRYNYVMSVDRLDWWFILYCAFGVEREKFERLRHHTDVPEENMKSHKRRASVEQICNIRKGWFLMHRSRSWFSLQAKTIITFRHGGNHIGHGWLLTDQSHSPPIFLVLRPTEFPLSAGAVQRKVSKRQAAEECDRADTSNKSSTLEPC